MKIFSYAELPNACCWLYLKLIEEHPNWTIIDVKNYLLENPKNKE
jgi:hypothetical protein